MVCKTLPICAALLTGGLVPLAQAQSRSEVYEMAQARSAQVCPDDTDERTRPGVKAQSVKALWKLGERGYTLCPDLKLAASAPVAWYAAEGVFAWNPRVRGAVTLLAAKVNVLTHSDDFPTRTVVWRADGDVAQGVTAPPFQRRPAATAAR